MRVASTWLQSIFIKVLPLIKGIGLRYVLSDWNKRQNQHKHFIWFAKQAYENVQTMFYATKM